jgi:uncharacterized repeat protein (TIGR01451 family)
MQRKDTILPRATAAIVVAASVIALHASIGRSFTSIAPGYAQHLWGVSSLRSSSGTLAGVVVLQSGEAIAAECRSTSTTRLHSFDPTNTSGKNDSRVHQEAVTGNVIGGCGIAFLNVGGQDYIFSNINDASTSDGDGTFGVARIAWPSLSTTKMAPGAPGNWLGIAVDPLTGDVVYAGATCRLANPQPPACVIYRMNPVSGVATPFLSLPGSQFGYIDGLAFEPSGAYLFLTNRTASPSGELDVVDRLGQVWSRTTLSTEPVGLGFHATSPKFVVSNNQNGTMTRFDFPGDDYSQPPAVSLFASGGFRGDLMQAGPDGCLYVTQLQARYDNGLIDNNNSLVQICSGFAPPPGITPNPPPEPASLCGFVYNDASNNGSKDSGEAGIAGVTVSLSGSDNLDIPVSASVASGSDGSYCFNKLQAGTYTITESHPAGYLDGKDTQGTPGSGTTSNDTFSNITLAPGVNGANNNFGELLASSLGGVVYLDADNNGSRSATETGIAGVTITLTGTDDRGAGVNMPGATGSDGAYSFTNLRPGTYTIRETQPVGYPDGKDTQGTPGTGTIGNDAFGNITLGQNVNGQDNNFGELPPVPAVSLVKKTNGSDNNQLPGVYIPVGSTVTWTYVVSNTGNAALGSIAVTDDRIGAVTCPATTLDVNRTMTCTATGVAVAGQYTNVGTVTAADALGTVVTASDRDSYFGSAAALLLVKKTNGADNDTAPGASIVADSPVTWTYAITNSGNVTLTNVAVTDDKLGSICTPAPLAPGASTTCTKSGTAVAGQYTNVGTVTAKDPAGQTIRASNADNYFGVRAMVSLVKKTNGTNNNTGTGPLVTAGSPVTWTYTITNTGNVVLANLAVVDDKAGPVTCAATTLAPGAAITCSKTGTATVGQYTNTGTVTATDPGGRPVSAQDVDHYLGLEPPSADLAVTSMAPATGTSGGTFTYTVNAVNRGVSPANTVVLTAAIPAGMQITALAPAPVGWACVTLPTKATVTCTKASMAVAESVVLSMTVTLACPFPNPAPSLSTLTATIGSATIDPNAPNNTATSKMAVMNPPPTITGAGTDVTELWPPNHKMVPILVSYSVTPACGGTPTVVIDVSSNEGDSSDWKIKDAHHLDLRSERLGTQKEGRVYTITIIATDPTGTKSEKAVTVVVPHDQGHGKK